MAIAMPRAMEDNMKTGHEKSFARHFPTVARVLMGLLFFASGLANLINLTPQPPCRKGPPPSPAR
jgi:uncharacterized membrane protein YphA (DoxX/SURF4 family)